MVLFPSLPVIYYTVPTTVPAGSPDFPLTLIGENFPGTLDVLWNGTALPLGSGAIGPTKISVTVPAAVIGLSGAGDVVTVMVKFQLGGGILYSNSVTVIVSPVPPPVGTLYIFLGAAAPVGYVLADGSTINPIDPLKAPLAALIGSTYNLPTDPKGIVRLPNLCGRTPVGAGQGPGLTMRKIGQLLGEETHGLTTAELPGHTHSGKTYAANPKFYRTVVDPNDVSSYANHQKGWKGGGYKDATDDQFSNSDHTHNFTTDNGNGGSQPHENMQPSVVVNFIIKL